MFPVLVSVQSAAAHRAATTAASTKRIRQTGIRLLWPRRLPAVDPPVGPEMLLFATNSPEGVSLPSVMACPRRLGADSVYQALRVLRGRRGRNVRRQRRRRPRWRGQDDGSHGGNQPAAGCLVEPVAETTVRESEL